LTKQITCDILKLVMRKCGFVTVVFVCCFLFCQSAYPFWIWTPKDKKIVYPKHAAKDSPEEHFNWAMGFFKEKNYKRAAEEFDRLAVHFKDSDLAPEAQYYCGRSYEAMAKWYPAFVAYQKTIDTYPFTKRNEEIIEREYALGNRLYKKHRGMLMGKEIMTDLDRAAEIFRKVKENAPFGKYGDQAQLMVGQCYKKSEQYNEAMKEFQRLVDEHPRSRLANKARYEAAQCTYLASLKPDYDQELTDEAIKEFRRIAQAREGMSLSEEAEERISMLKEKKAQSLLTTAKFYEGQRRYKSAAVYYRDLVDNYPVSSCAALAREKLALMEERVEKKRLQEARFAGRPKMESLLSIFSFKGKSEKKSAEADEIKTVKPDEAKSRKPFLSFMSPKKEKPSPEEADPGKPGKTAPKKPFFDFLSPKKKTDPAETKSTAPNKPGGKQFNLLGYTSGSNLPEAECSVYVDNFVNKINVTEETSDNKPYYAYLPGMEAEITRRIINRFIFDGNYEIKDARSANFILKGQLIDFKREPLRYDADNKVLEYRLSIVVNIELYKTADNKPVWHENHFAGESTFRTTGQFAKAENLAAQDAMHDLAERVVERTVESW